MYGYGYRPGPRPGLADHIVRLQEELRQNRQNRQNREERGLWREKNTSVVARTASVEQRERDIERFLRHGWSIEDTCEGLRAPYSVVARVAKRLEEQTNTRPHDIDIIMPKGEGGYFAILQK